MEARLRYLRRGMKEKNPPPESLPPRAGSVVTKNHIKHSVIMADYERNVNMNLSNDKRGLMEIYSDAERNNDTDMLIAIHTIIRRLLERQGAVPPDQTSGFGRGGTASTVRICNSEKMASGFY
ncbi:hypothetical protein [Oscillibacter sp.]|uniref:hypothetical protein n=1 Tax=Oscillibacter sp. TaxID=1945593 RepID=UPI00289A7456|nr:hypothetical protein [Oscillibacter sp.]